MKHTGHQQRHNKQALNEKALIPPPDEAPLYGVRTCASLLSTDDKEKAMLQGTRESSRMKPGHHYGQGRPANARARDTRAKAVATTTTIAIAPATVVLVHALILQTPYNIQQYFLRAVGIALAPTPPCCATGTLVSRQRRIGTPSKTRLFAMCFPQPAALAHMTPVETYITLPSTFSDEA